MTDALMRYTSQIMNKMNGMVFVYHISTQQFALSEGFFKETGYSRSSVTSMKDFINLFPLIDQKRLHT